MDRRDKLIEKVAAELKRAIALKRKRVFDAGGTQDIDGKDDAEYPPYVNDRGQNI